MKDNQVCLTAAEVCICASFTMKQISLFELFESSDDSGFTSARFVNDERYAFITFVIGDVTVVVSLPCKEAEDCCSYYGAVFEFMGTSPFKCFAAYS